MNSIKSFEIRRITTSYEALPRANSLSVSLATLCGCLVNLWSVPTSALRALTRSKRVRALRPLVPRPQHRTALFLGPWRTRFSAIFRIRQPVATPWKFHATKRAEFQIKIFGSRTEKGLVPSLRSSEGPSSRDEPFGNAIRSDTARLTAVFPHRPATPR